MNQRLVLSITLVVLWTVGVFSQCEPECPPIAPGAEVADPKNCSQYYVCLTSGLPSSVPLACDDPNGVNIYFDPNAVPPGCQSDDTKCQVTCVPPPCQLACDGTHDFVADPGDCNVYYECLPGGVSSPLTCPPATPNYDSVTQVCVADGSVCCTDLCTPYCSVQYSQIPDPADCTMYYLCMVVGLADSPTNVHDSCPVGENFDIRTGMCSPDAPCTILCGGGNQISTSTTPTSGCLDSLTCAQLGFFAACTTCTQKYFHCTVVGQPAQVGYCIGELVFDTNPNNPYCVTPSNCPSV